MKHHLKEIVRQSYYLALMVTASWALDYFNWAVKKVPPAVPFKPR